MQKSFSMLEYESKRKQTRRDKFLGEFDRLVPWKELEEEIAPYYPQVKGTGRHGRGASAYGVAWR